MNGLYNQTDERMKQCLELKDRECYESDGCSADKHMILFIVFKYKNDECFLVLDRVFFLQNLNQKVVEAYYG